MKGFKFLKDAPIADVAFEAWGKNYEELFEAAGLALTTTMIEPKELNSLQQKLVACRENSLPELLYTFLGELLILKDQGGFLANQFKVKIKKKGKKWSLGTTCLGETLNLEKHHPHNDVKAISWHEFSIGKDKKKGLKAQVILDI